MSTPIRPRGTKAHTIRSRSFCPCRTADLDSSHWYPELVHTASLQVQAHVQVPDREEVMAVGSGRLRAQRRRRHRRRPYPHYRLPLTLCLPHCQMVQTREPHQHQIADHRHFLTFPPLLPQPAGTRSPPAPTVRLLLGSPPVAHHRNILGRDLRLRQHTMPSPTTTANFLRAR